MSVNVTYPTTAAAVEVPTVEIPAAAAPAAGRTRPRTGKRRLAARWSAWWRAVTDPAPVGGSRPDLVAETLRRDALWSRDPRPLR